MVMLGLEITHAEDVYNSVVALYSVLLEGREQLRVRRAVLGVNNECKAEELDFLADVELRAKQALSPKQYALFLAYTLASAPYLVPEDAQLALGTVWNANGLSLDGSYRSLYFKIKNQNERDAMRARVNGNTESDQFD